MAVYAMNSGGNDSLVVTHLLAQHPAFTAVAHVNTGTGVPETTEHVRGQADRAGWRLIEKATPWSVYREAVLQHGFPGPASHLIMYSLLKERRVREIVAEAKAGRGDRVALVTGVRKSESKRRMGTVKPVAREGAKVWTAPILYWSDDDKDRYIQENGLQRNPVSVNLCMSGECLCGSFAEGPQELLQLAHFYPEVARRIRALENEAHAAGVHSRWGVEPPRAQPVAEGQQKLGLCWTCERRAES